jgi:hypothetical protein
MGASTATVVGGSMVLLGATGLYLISANERLEAAHATEGLNREYLELAEYDNIAKALARNSDDGDSVGPILLQLSNYLGIDQKSLLQWLNDQDPDWVRMFVLKAFNVERGDDGFAKERNGKNFKVLPRGPIEHEHDIKYWDSIPDGTPPAWSAVALHHPQVFGRAEYYSGLPHFEGNRGCGPRGGAADQRRILPGPGA